ncbi:hypothetical protein [Microbacterium sp. NPDC076895]|uniref:hypothetical protein n=1 Tax=Microbacterium sp. NPDC076895 TaxID=3154957 RepID=UPI0034222725
MANRHGKSELRFRLEDYPAQAHSLSSKWLSDHPDLLVELFGEKVTEYEAVRKWAAQTTAARIGAAIDELPSEQDRELAEMVFAVGKRFEGFDAPNRRKKLEGFPTGKPFRDMRAAVIDRIEQALLEEMKYARPEVEARYLAAQLAEASSADERDEQQPWAKASGEDVADLRQLARHAQVYATLVFGLERWAYGMAEFRHRKGRSEFPLDPSEIRRSQVADRTYVAFALVDACIARLEARPTGRDILRRSGITASWDSLEVIQSVTTKDVAQRRAAVRPLLQVEWVTVLQALEDIDTPWGFLHDWSGLFSGLADNADPDDVQSEASAVRRHLVRAAGLTQALILQVLPGDRLDGTDADELWRSAAPEELRGVGVEVWRGLLEAGTPEKLSYRHPDDW